MKDWEYKPAKDLGMKPHERRLSLQRESGLVETTTHHLRWGFIRSYLRLYHRIEIHGREHMPAKPPFVLVANHASHLDAMILAAFLPMHLRDKVFPIAAGDVFFETPMMSTFATACINALPMWRKNCGPHALKQLREKLVGDPCGYILFPEGGRSRDGQIMPFKAGIGMLVANTDVPIVPCHIEGALAALHADSKLPRPCKLRLRIGPSLNFAAVQNRKAGWGQVTDSLRQAVEALAPK